MKRVLAILLSLVLLIGIMPVSALAVEGTELDVAVFWYDFNDWHMSEVRDAMDAELDPANMQWTNYNADSTQATQNDQIDYAIDRGADVLVVNIVDTAAIDAAQAIVDKAAAAEIPVIFFGREVADEVIESYENACYVGTRAAEAGGMQGKMAADYIIANYDDVDLNDDGQISYIMMKGELGNPEAEMRTRYAVEFCNNALLAAEKPELVYYDESNTDCFQPSNWSRTQAFELMETALSTNPMDGEDPIEVVFANNDDAALGCIEALNNADWNTGEGNFIPVFGIDCVVDAMAAMEEGKMTGSVSMPVDGFAETIASLIDNVVNGENVFANANENFNVDNDGVAKIRVPYEMILEGEVHETDYDFDYDYDDDFDFDYGDYEIVSGECGDNLSWNIDSSGTLTISGEGDMWDYYEDYPEWYYWGFDSVVIEEGVTSIGGRAFADAYFADIYIPASVTNIASDAFWWTGIGSGIWVDEANENYSSDEYGVLFNKDMTELLIAPSGIPSMYYIPASVAVIADNAFSSEWELNILVFEGDAPAFGEYAFSSISATVFYPENNETWTEDVLQGYDGYVTWQSYDPENPDFTLYGDCGDNLTWALDVYGTLTISGEGEMWSYNEDYPSWAASSDIVTDVIIEEGVTSIGAYTFYEHFNINEIIIPASVKFIGAHAFTDCNIYGGIWVDEENQNYCNDEYGVLYEESMELLIKAPYPLFENYIVPEGVKAIGEYAFANSYEMPGVTLPESLEVISNYAFANSWEFTEINIPAGVSIIGDHAFMNCESLEAFKVDENNEFYTNDENGVLFDKEMTTLIKAPGQIFGTYVIPEGVKTIADSAFNCSYQIVEFVLPETLEYIGDGAFSGNWNITSLTIPENVKFVSNNAFSGCEVLKKITVEGDNTTFAEWAFDGCWSLSKIIFEGDAPKFGGFDFHWPEVRVYYPQGNETWTEEIMTGYGDMATFIEYDPSQPIPTEIIDSGECGENLTWELNEDGLLTISGEGDMYDFDSYDTPWSYYTDYISEVVIEEGATSIGDWAFENCYRLSSISIPETVTRIGNGAFFDVSALIEINIPAAVTEIDWNNFRYCDSLTAIWVDEENEYYSSDENGALYNKEGTELLKVPGAYEGSYTVSAGATTIGDDAFIGCHNITEIVIHENITYISPGAFYQCYNLANFVVDEDNEAYCVDEYGVLYNESMTTLIKTPVTIESYTVPATVNWLGWEAFCHCENLSEITFVGNAPEIGSSYLFTGVIATVYYPENNPTWTEDVMQDYDGEIEWIPYEGGEISVLGSGVCGDNVTWEISVDGTLIISGEGDMWNFDEEWPTWNTYSDHIVNVVIEEGVTGIGAFTFETQRISNVYIPASVERIAPSAFRNCYILNGIWVDEANEYYCSDEYGVLFEEDLEVLMKAPWNVYEVYNVPEGVVAIEAYAFDWCDFAGVTLPDSLEVISESAFQACYNFTSINIPAGVNIIGDYAFYGCDAIEEFIVDENNKFYSNDEYGVLFNKDKTELIQATHYLTGTYTIPEGVQTIAGTAFAMCHGLNGVVLPDTLTYIADTAFANCAQLTSVTLPESVRYVGNNAFIGCESLRKIIVEGDNTAFAEYAFNGCENLIKIVFEGDAPKFGGLDFSWPEVTVYYPQGNETWTEEIMTGYGDLATFVEYDPSQPIPSEIIASGECGENLTWKLNEDGLLTISGEGDMYNYDYYETPWNDYRDLIRSVVIEEGVTSIGDTAFNPCVNLNNVSIADTVTRIGENAFNECLSLTEIYISAAVTEIGYGAFNYCTAMTGIWVDEENEYFSNDEEGVLYNKSQTELIKVPCGYMGDYVVADSITTIGWCVFIGCEAVTSIHFGENINYIDDTTFNYCLSLEKIIVDEDNEYYCNDQIGALYDKDMTELIKAPVTVESYTVPATVEEFGYEAFWFCYDLTEIIFEGDAPRFNGDEFWRLTATVYYPANNPTWTEKVMQDYDGDIEWVGYVSEEREMGDVNNDGRITNADVIILARYLVNIFADNPEICMEVEQYGDVNGDGEIKNSDLIRLARTIVSSVN